MKTAHRHALLVPLVSCALTGCSRAPSIDIIGSFFPVWMLCLTCAVILTFFARMLLARYQARTACRSGRALLSLPAGSVVLPAVAVLFR
jgi:hypothetical protein